MRLGGGAMIILVIVGMLFGINPFEMLGMMGGGDSGSVQAPPQQSAPPGYGPQTGHGSHRRPAGSPAAVNKDFSTAVLGDTEDVWGAIFKAMGQRYEPPKLVLYRGGTRSACGQRERGGRAVLLPGRPRALSRHVVLQRAAQRASARRATSRRRT